MKILIIEDDKNQADTLTHLLVKLFRDASEAISMVTQARTLQEGIKLSHQIKADITLLDPGLPDTVGLDGSTDYTIVGRAIKQGMLYPPVIITTGMPDPDKAIEIYFMKCGAQQVFHKPYVERVVALIASAAAGAAMRKLVADQRNDRPK